MYPNAKVRKQSTYSLVEALLAAVVFQHESIESLLRELRRNPALLATRNTLKYRCPAAAYGLECAGRETCYRQAGTKAGAYGRIVRIDIKKQDRRIFTPTPYDSPSWRRGYNRRSALERINSREASDSFAVL